MGIYVNNTLVYVVNATTLDPAESGHPGDRDRIGRQHVYPVAERWNAKCQPHDDDYLYRGRDRIWRQRLSQHDGDSCCRR